jgi:hypothetical protein
MKSLSDPKQIDSAFKDFFLEAQKENKELKKDIHEQKVKIHILEAKLIAIKITIESFNE